MAPRLLLFDLALGGHHGNYIKYLIEYAHQQSFAGVIDIVVSQHFFETHPDTVRAVGAYASPAINFVPITVAEEASLGSRQKRLDRVFRNFREWQLFHRYAKKLGTTHALIMYFDTCKLPLLAGVASPCPFTGIYFRPTFHYGRFGNHRSSWRESWQKLREKAALKKILGNPQLDTLLCLDPFAAQEMAESPYRNKIIHLVDPVPVAISMEMDVFALRAKLGIEAHRQVFLLFGALDERKGIYQLLDAIKLLSSESCSRFCLLLVGKTSRQEQERIQPQITEIRAAHPVQLIECYEFISEQEVSTYFQLADVILAPYQRHVGMSGILLLAAAAAKPVLSSDYGLMGELVRKYHLGLAIDSSQPTEIATAISHYLQETTATSGNPLLMQKFAAENSIERYASTVFQHLGILSC
jgi:glycosyltransferase involved in cell wall biosynthesis